MKGALKSDEKLFFSMSIWPFDIFIASLRLFAYYKNNQIFLKILILRFR